MKRYSSRRCHRGKLAFRTPSRFISKKYTQVSKNKPKKR